MHDKMLETLKTRCDFSTGDAALEETVKGKDSRNQKADIRKHLNAMAAAEHDQAQRDATGRKLDLAVIVPFQVYTSEAVIEGEVGWPDATQAKQAEEHALQQHDNIGQVVIIITVIFVFPQRSELALVADWWPFVCLRRPLCILLEVLLCLSEVHRPNLLAHTGHVVGVVILISPCCCVIVPCCPIVSTANVEAIGSFYSFAATPFALAFLHCVSFFVTQPTCSLEALALPFSIQGPIRSTFVPPLTSFSFAIAIQ